MKKGLVLCLLLPALISARQAQKVDQVELQPLTAQVRRLIEAMDYLGAPIKQADREALEKAGDETDAAKARRSVQDALDKYCLFEVHINPKAACELRRARPGRTGRERLERVPGQGAQRGRRHRATQGRKPERLAALGARR